MKKASSSKQPQQSIRRKLTRIRKGQFVRLKYKLTNGEGALLDSSEYSGPLPYVHGEGTIAPGLETALEGRALHDNIVLTLSPEQGFGYPREELVFELDKTDFEDSDRLEVGYEFEMETNEGSFMAVVTEVEGSRVMVDANHPLAGEVLNFDVTVMEIRKPTAQEMQRGIEVEQNRTLH